MLSPFAMSSAGSTTSFIGWVATGSNGGSASTCENESAGSPFTVTADTGMSWKSRLNSLRSCVAFALIVVFVPARNSFATGS